MLSHLIGQDYAVEVLRSALREGHVTGSFLFLGPDAVGKTMAAVQFAKAMLCEHPAVGPDCCDTCPSCVAIAESRHPDFRCVAPVGPSRILRIPQIWPREGVRDFPPDAALLHDLSFAPMRGKRRVFLLESADALNDDTANSLLKVLEDPPPYATFVLTAPSSSAVLPTIFSRCQTVRFRSVPEAAIAAEIVARGLADQAEARFVAALSQGRIGAALRMARDEGLRTVRDKVLRIAQEIAAAGEPIVALRLADELRKSAAKLTPTARDGGEVASADVGPRQSAVAALEILALWYRDLLAIAVVGDQARPINSDHGDALRRSAEGYAPAQLQFALELILDVRRCVERNANAQIAFEALLLRLCTLRSKQYSYA